MKSRRGPTEIVLLGTMHVSAREYPKYAKRLAEIIEEISPEIICSELSPEQLAGTQPCNSKPEQRDVVMPTARRLGIPIVPIQPGTEIGLKFEKKVNSAERAVRGSARGRNFLKFARFLAEKEAELWMQHLDSPSCIENVQANEYHVFGIARDMMHEKWMPRLVKLWNEWNESFLAKILETVEKNRGSSILVITGLWHKHWLWQRLVINKKIILNNLHTIRQLHKR
jgi:hypothetical protein